MIDNNNKLEIGDVVSVNFNNAQYTLAARAEVIYMPCSTGDGWIFKDLDNGKTHYVSEGCTVTKI